MKRTEQFWDSSAGNYDRTEERFEYIHNKSRENARKHLNAGDVVLDYGCGTGTTACDAAPLVGRIEGIDISSAMIGIANEKAAAAGIENVEFRQADMFDDAFEAESFDVILAFNVLHTVPEPQRAVRRMHELLRPDGLIISVTPCFSDRASVLGRIQLLLVRLLCTIRVIPIPIRSVGSTDLDDLLLHDGSFEMVDAEVIFRGTSSYFAVAKKRVGERT